MSEPEALTALEPPWFWVREGPHLFQDVLRALDTPVPGGDCIRARKGVSCRVEVRG